MEKYHAGVGTLAVLFDGGICSSQAKAFCSFQTACVLDQFFQTSTQRQYSKSRLLNELESTIRNIYSNRLQEEATQAEMQLFLFRLLGIVATACVVLGQSSSGDVMRPNSSLRSDQTLISRGGVFQLGFFSLVNGSASGFLGIRHNDLPTEEAKVVWVANRNKSLDKSTASLNLTSDGNLILFDEQAIVWSTGTSTELNSARLQLLDSGNLVLLTAGSSSRTLWQSFDHPSDVLLPGMKLGFDRRINTTWQLVSWRSAVDPSPGEYITGISTRGIPGLVTWEGAAKIYRTGPWNGQGFVRFPQANSSLTRQLDFIFVSNENETYYMNEYKDSSARSLGMLDADGVYKRWSWENGSWEVLWSVPLDECDHYNRCGSSSVCTEGYYDVSCSCLEGFAPAANGSGGCVRQKPLSCSSSQVWTAQNVKLPDSENATARGRMSVDVCRDLCLGDCSCVAYAVQGGPNGCMTWRGDLLDLRDYSDDVGEDLYVRLAGNPSPASNRTKIVPAIAIPLSLGFLLLCCLSFLIRRRSKGNSVDHGASEPRLIAIDSEHSASHNNRGRSSAKTLGSLFSYDLHTIKLATNDFSNENKLGEGGFGVVYKGQLQDGSKIAVKKLSNYSSQGPNEFHNELSLIAKLQHRNLVRLLGSCIEGDERLIILEYMENKSLDALLFDKTKSILLNWQKRLEIIMGIARGLLYLHQDSILRVIHRDLKPSNILLDKDMIPKISDFGIARIVEGDGILENATTRPIGTFGYMAPEYLADGYFSFKSDVFSFGVIVLEILSGKRNRVFSQTNTNLNLLAHAYKLWKEGSSLKILDDSLDCSYPTIEILRCIQMALLCVQDNCEDRPMMVEVMMMLTSENQLLTLLKQPVMASTSTSSEGDLTTEEMSLTPTG